MPQEKKLLDIVREKLRIKHYSYQTEKTYIGWIKRYVFFHNKRHPREMGKDEIETFLTSLATTRKVSASTQNQAFNALLFLYEQVLGISFKDQNIQAIRAKQREHFPAVLTQEEVQSVIYHMQGFYKLMLLLMYGCGLRMAELLKLRIKDIDFGFDNVYVWDSKSLKDRIVPLPQKIKEELKLHVAEVKKIHEKDISQGYGETILPFGLEKKYPNANKEFMWQYLFPMRTISTDPISNGIGGQATLRIFSWSSSLIERRSDTKFCSSFHLPYLIAQRSLSVNRVSYIAKLSFFYWSVDILCPILIELHIRFT